jgi:hypothetical protein
MNSIEKMLSIRSNNIIPTIISSDGSFTDNFQNYIRENSRILNKSIIVEGNPQQNFYFDIENTSKRVFEGNNITEQFKPMKDIHLTPKMLVSEIGMSLQSRSIFFDTFGKKSEKKEEEFLKKIMYSPFLRSVEKNVISGNYFNKSIFNICENITGSSNFSSLLNLIRKLKEKNSENIVILHPSIMNKIIDSITKESYLNEYLMNQTIEGVDIITTLECPDTKIVGVNPTEICLVICSEIQCKKISVVGLDGVYQVMVWVEGGDLFNTSIGMEV